MIDRIKATLQHYSERRGSMLAAAVTCYAFLSFFPIVLLGFAGVGAIAGIWPDAEETLDAALRDALPGIIGNGDNQLSLRQIKDAAGATAGIGLVTALYAGTGWISGMRTALMTMFDVEEPEAPDAVVGKARHFLLQQLSNAGALLGIGAVLLVSVAISGALVSVIGAAAVPVGILANAVLLLAMFRILANPAVPLRSLAEGAIIGGVAIEALKQLSRLLLASTSNAPAFQAFGVALIVLVWIHYFSRVVMISAAWSSTATTGAATSPTPA